MELAGTHQVAELFEKFESRRIWGDGTDSDENGWNAWRNKAETRRE
jgi:hypothetical protein